MRHLRAGLRLVALLAWLLTFCFVGTFTFLLSYNKFHPQLVLFCNRGALLIANVTLHIFGAPPGDTRGLLLVANHCSYLDIPVYGSILPVCYTPKAEIKRWPFIGQLTILARSIFITRDKDAAHGQREQIRAALHASNNILLFPEGTTNDGEHIKPFKSTLFSVAEPREDGAAIPVQAMALAYTKIEGRLPKSGRMLDRVAWYGDMWLVPHLWGLLSMKHIEATVTFLPQLAWQGTRKEMAALYGKQVVDALKKPQQLSSRHPN